LLRYKCHGVVLFEAKPCSARVKGGKRINPLWCINCIKKALKMDKEPCKVYHRPNNVD